MIKLLLWDIDGTLLDFSAAEKAAVRACCAAFSLPYLSDEQIGRYARINKSWWEKLERGEATKPAVLFGRFSEFFASEGIAFDRIDDFNALYQVKLGDTIVEFDRAGELLATLRERGILQAAVTNGTAIAQEKKLKKSGFDRLFDGIFISEQVGFEKPRREFFDRVLERMGTFLPDEVMIVGDSLTSDIRGGLNAGIVTCHYNPTRQQNTTDIRPHYEIQNLWELLPLIER